MEDPKTEELMAKWFNPRTFEAQQKLARPREAQKSPWFPEWDTFNQEQIQTAVLGNVSPKDALKASADKALDLKKRR